MQYSPLSILSIMMVVAFTLLIIPGGSSLFLKAEGLTPEEDTDGNGMADSWEIKYFGNLNKDGTGDSDSDGYTDLEEYVAGSDPTNPRHKPYDEGEDNILDTIWNGITDLPREIWDFFVENIISFLELIMGLWIGLLQEIRSIVYTVFWGIAGVEGEIYESEWGNAILTFNLIISTAALLGLMGLVRLWVFILDVAPII